MKKGLLVLAVLALGAWGAGAQAQSVTPRSDIWEFHNGIKLCDECTTITGSTTAGNASVVLPDSSVGAQEMSGAFLRVTYCGENAENSVVYMGALALTLPDEAIGSTACDALDSGTEATADVVLSTVLALAPRYMVCAHDATLGAGETIAYQLRDDTASVTGVTCTSIEATTGCEVATPTAPALAPASASAVRITQASNNADGDESKCHVIYAIQ